MSQSTKHQEYYAASIADQRHAKYINEPSNAYKAAIKERKKFFVCIALAIAVSAVIAILDHWQTGGVTAIILFLMIAKYSQGLQLSIERIERKETSTKHFDAYMLEQHTEGLYEAACFDKAAADEAKLNSQRRESWKLQEERWKRNEFKPSYQDSKRPRVPVKHTVRAYNDPRVSKPEALPLVKPAKIKGWQSLRKQCFSLWGNRCAKCSWTPGNNEQHLLHVDHIKPKILYPELADDINNLQPMCHSCNTSKGDREEVDYRPRKAS